MAAGDYIIPGARAVTQWSIGFINACGEAALAVLQGIQNGVAPSISQVQALARAGVQFGTNPSGTSTIPELAKLAQASGTPVTQGAGGQAALDTINANLLAGKPTEVGVSRASVFGGSDKNVQGHFVTVVGRATNGNYIVADSNQPQALQGQFVQYGAAQILQAQPFGTLTPTNGPISGLANTLTAPLGGLFAAFGTSPQDFAWRSALIVGGMALIVIGLLVFFSHQEEQAVTVVSQNAGKAASTAAAAAT